jgi:hypothetical protein
MSQGFAEVMELTGLRSLYNSMRQQGFKRYSFYFQRSGVKFQIFFFIDTDPYQLLIGSLGERSFFLLCEVKLGFNINSTLSPDKYKELCKVLGLTYDPTNRFKPSDFFSDLNLAIPAIANVQGIAKPQDVARIRRDVEEADKKYFCGWLDNSKTDKHVSAANLDKTLKNCGQEIHDFCQRRNISTRWTDIEELAQEWVLPWELSNKMENTANKT